jgi:hypothetical protein
VRLGGRVLARVVALRLALLPQLALALAVPRLARGGTVISAENDSNASKITV